MHFALSGHEALEVLANEPFDVIVTDMRMPKMDGAALLKLVKQQYPDVIRIVLSGHAELEAAVRAVPVSHQFLAKPCDPNKLEDAIRRACDLRELVGDDAIREKVGKLHRIPSAPKVYSKLVMLLEDPEASAPDIAAVVQQDVAMSAKLLQISNSAFFGLLRPVRTIEQAVVYLGVTMVKNLALSVEVFDGSTKLFLPRGLSLESLQQHSLLVGRIASQLLDEPVAKDDAFIAGCLHEVGLLILASHFGKRLHRIVTQVRKQGCDLRTAEQNVLHITHAELGGYLLGLWGLPYSIVEAVTNHHDPEGRSAPRHFDVLCAVHVANQLANELGPPLVVGETEREGGIDETLLERLGATDRLVRARKIAAELCGPNNPFEREAI